MTARPSLLFVKGSSVRNVRLSKFRTYFARAGIPAEFWVWDRLNSGERAPDVRTLFSGGGHGGTRLLLYYPVWMTILFFRFLFLRRPDHWRVVAVNFDSALPVSLAARIRRFPYVYEIRDEFALSYRFPRPVKALVRAVDHWVMRKARLVIHVDENRVTYDHCRSVVIENTPFDRLGGRERDYHGLRHRFAVIGNLSPNRGMASIAEFARLHPEVEFLLVGIFYDRAVSAWFDGLPNVERRDYMPQEELFGLLEECAGIFSLYDPALEINRLAASNKVYDAMMLGIPVITNPEVANSAFIRDRGVGILASYRRDATWEALAAPDYLERAKEIGARGRKLYLERYPFDKLIEKKLLCEVWE